MTMDAILNSLDGLSEEMQKEYKAGTGDLDGKFVLDVKGVSGMVLENVTNLKKSLEKERTNSRTAVKKLEAFEGIKDPKSALEAIEKVKEFANFNPEEVVAEKIKARESELIKRHDAEKKQLVSANQDVIGQLENLLVDQVATKALMDAKGSIELLLPILRRNVKMRKTDNGYIAEIVDAEGNPRIGDSDANPMTMPQLVAEMKGNDAFAPAFEGSGTTGSGATGDGGKTGAAGGSKSGTVKTVSMNDQDALDSNIEGIAKGQVTVVDS